MPSRLVKEKTRKEVIWQSQERTKEWSWGAAALQAYLIWIALLALALLIRPFRKLRIGLLYHRAIGRFCGNTEYFLRERKFRPPREKEAVVLISGNVPVNKQILTMVGRRLTVIKSDRLSSALNYLRKVTPDNSIWIDLGCTGWLRGAEWSVPGPQLSFTPEEHRRGQEILRQLGIPEGAPHVCFFAKDSLYTDSPDTKLDPNSY